MYVGVKDKGGRFLKCRSIYDGQRDGRKGTLDINFLPMIQGKGIRRVTFDAEGYNMPCGSRKLADGSAKDKKVYGTVIIMNIKYNKTGRGLRFGSPPCII